MSLANIINKIVKTHESLVEYVKASNHQHTFFLRLWKFRSLWKMETCKPEGHVQAIDLSIKRDDLFLKKRFLWLFLQ